MSAPDTRGPYADDAGAALSAASDLGVYLALWAMRYDDKPDAEARQSANLALDTIDTALRKLHALRERLVGDIRAYDDATAARVDALLAERRPDQRAAALAARMSRKSGGDQ